MLATANWIDNVNVCHGGFMVRQHVEKTMNLVSVRQQGPHISSNVNTSSNSTQFPAFTNWLTDNPNFKEPIANVTAPVGREAILSCVVQDLAGYKLTYDSLERERAKDTNGLCVE
ncbi:hypothetical protein HZH68_005266 [Vespula germanica]|uniref:Ig-like domain-containing protein n=1 Tax=Vespula germanica TaxID=30212 RepID=A0A834KH84_VESGE|nr:hypothetical protein HZH68_005266 [Vespula germanica]